MNWKKGISPMKDHELIQLLGAHGRAQAAPEIELVHRVMRSIRTRPEPMLATPETILKYMAVSAFAAAAAILVPALLDWSSLDNPVGEFLGLLPMGLQ
jgi:hypothetical protein